MRRHLFLQFISFGLVQLFYRFFLRFTLLFHVLFQNIRLLIRLTFGVDAGAGHDVLGVGEPYGAMNILCKSGFQGQYFKLVELLNVKGHFVALLQTIPPLSFFLLLEKLLIVPKGPEIVDHGIVVFLDI